ncbi:hypothetical protein MKX01_005943 [Papaver californicum]|nr:hypothetical protein MKX01_005943 [Papaver californicum]
MEWIKGEMIGKGSFGTVNIATLRRTFDEYPSVMAVKSSMVSQSSMLEKEKEILTQLNGCPQILQCFGEDITVENGVQMYNIFLEFASLGNLSQLIKSGSSMAESEIKNYTRMITQGIGYIHEMGFVHSDIKPQNILLCSGEGKIELKIADFGLTKRSGKSSNGFIGTPLYMSPELVSCNENETPSDIWALGCVVMEMITRKPAWRCSDLINLLYRIGFTEQVPEIPSEISEEGKDFLRKCFIKDPTKRWTAEMLLRHPFISNNFDAHVSTTSLKELKRTYSSPKSTFDFPESWSDSTEKDESDCSACLKDRIGELVLGKEPNWSTSDSWIVVR